MIRVCAVLPALLLAAAVGAQEPAKAPEDKRVCRNVGSTGSRIPLRECHLQSEWKVIDQAQTSQTADMQRRMNDGVGGAMVTNSPIPR